MELITEHGIAVISAFAGIVTIAAAVQRILGFAFGLVVLGLLPRLFDQTGTDNAGIHLANLAGSIIAVIPLMMLCFQFFREADWRAIAVTGVSSFAGLPAGMWVYEAIPPTWLARLTGGIILLLILDSFLRRNPNTETTPVSLRWGMLAGGAAGVLHGSVGLPGPPIVIFATRQQWSPNAFRGFTACSMIWLSLAKIGLFAWRGHIDQEVGTWSLMGVPFVLVGYVLGQRVARWINPGLFRFLVLAVVTLSAVRLLMYEHG